jgi:hypothetical protein
MAATHGLDEQAEQIKESLDENVIESVLVISNLFCIFLVTGS